MDIFPLLRLAREQHASDLLISVGAGPALRINGELKTMGEPITPAEAEQMARHLLTDMQWQTLMHVGEIDLSHSLVGVSRFRINIYRQRGYLSLAVRLIPNTVPTLDELGLPDVLKSLTEKSHGLVLVTGPTGSGKSTTLAAMIEYVNRTRRCHVITLEDPIEYLHSHQLALIDQREIGLDTGDFSTALRAALRQDPDVILIGEMRDLETISTAMTAAETGHLVLATLHTSDAVQTIDRIIDVFPIGQQAQIRIQLAAVLQAILSQRLYKTVVDQQRVAAFEVLVNTPAVANLIRSEKAHQIRSVMQTGKTSGMQTMGMHLKELVQVGLIPSRNVQIEP